MLKLFSLFGPTVMSQTPLAELYRATHAHQHNSVGFTDLTASITDLLQKQLILGVGINSIISRFSARQRVYYLIWKSLGRSWQSSRSALSSVKRICWLTPVPGAAPGNRDAPGRLHWTQQLFVSPPLSVRRSSCTCVFISVCQFAFLSVFSFLFFSFYYTSFAAFRPLSPKNKSL